VPYILWSSPASLQCVFNEGLSLAGTKLLGEWLAKRQEVLAALHAMPRTTLVSLLVDDCQAQPALGHLLLDSRVLTIVSEKQREVGLSLNEVHSSVLAKALRQDGGGVLDLLMERVPFEAGSVSFDGLKLVHRGAIEQIATHLPKLLEIGLPPDCKVSTAAVFVVICRAKYAGAMRAAVFAAWHGSCGW
jgi:hypothetical protein